MAQDILSISKDLLKILDCPVCHSNLVLDRDQLCCSNASGDCGRSFDVINGVPQMNADEVAIDCSSPRIGSAQKLLELSFRLANSSAWLIPAIRECAKKKFQQELNGAKTGNPLQKFSDAWNFEETLQKEIGRQIDKLITPEELGSLFVLQWKGNLARLAQTNRDQQFEFKNNRVFPNKFAPFNLTEREKIIKETVPKGGRLLYVGCGIGTECFRYEKMGYQVVGIDTEADLVQVMRDWKVLLGLQADSIQMNVLSLGFLPQSFDAAIVEIYGAYPSREKRIKMQRQLARVLKSQAFAFMVGNRFKYTQYMQRQNMYRDAKFGHYYENHLIQELLAPGIKEPEKEFDKDTDKLVYGVTRGSYTCESLSDELSACFNVTKCFRAGDKRYLLALVQPLPKEQWIKQEVSEAKIELPDVRAVQEADSFAKELEALIEIVKEHSEVTLAFLNKAGSLEAEAWNRLQSLLWKG